MNNRILVIDDEKMNLLLFKSLLKSYEITLVTALSGKEGIEYHRENKFDLILTDYNMPLLNGVQTLDILRELDKSKNTYTPILLFTADESKSILSWKEYGFNEVLFKPINKELLETYIEQYLFSNN
ncbi:MAG: response regulator [Bacteroidia bacterium]|nr:response regulator [Bacteroidia bacterium]MCF8428170.1 response regulator [Bacteroidia bacterium]MCF8445434.1 response regulator [Bacteroidia bacterium]